MVTLFLTMTMGKEVKKWSGEVIGGMGTAQYPFLIYTPEHLNSIGLIPCNWDKHFKLITDIDLSGFNGMEGNPAFQIIGRSFLPFTAVFDGKIKTEMQTTSTFLEVGWDFVGETANGTEDNYPRLW